MSDDARIPVDPADNAHYEIGPTGRVRKIRKPVWRRGYFSYLESSGVESAPVPGIVNGPWGIGKWNVLTHLPSGLRFGTFPTLKNAKSAAHRLEEVSIDWWQTNPDLVSFHEQLKTIVASEGSCR